MNQREKEFTESENIWMVFEGVCIIAQGID